MKYNYKGGLLIFIFLPYILFWSLGNVNIRVAASDQEKTTTDAQQIEEAGNNFPQLYTLPSVLSEVVLNIKRVSDDEQKSFQHHLWQCQMDYSQNNDLSSNHPIPAYKISLSEHSSDG